MKHIKVGDLMNGEVVSPLGAHLGRVAHAVLHHSAAPVAVVAHE